MTETLTAVMLEDVDGKPKASFKSLTVADLPDYDVLVDVAYSTVNYKDGLALTGKGKIARTLPMVCGVDLAGTVAESRSPDWKPGDRVVVNGWNLSETEWGGYIQKQRVRPEWLVRVPDAFTLAEAMAIGTAGYTAMLAVLALEQMGVRPDSQPHGSDILVTGAAGGVGSIAVAVLARLGYRVTASTGRAETHDYLKGLGATTIIDRASLLEKGQPLQRERWAGAVDSVGGVTLANVIAQTARHGAVAVCGLAGGADLPGSVFPFILRGVSLAGIDSVMAPKAKREQAWARLATDLDRGKLDAMTTIAPFTGLFDLAEAIVRGQIRGRTVVDVRATLTG
jgi:putative YhdH/YhfP family quinone oxidoreductase